MVTSAIAALGVTLSRDSHLIAELTNISGLETTLETIDVTSHDSADDFREYIGGLLDGGEIGIEGNFIGGDTDGQIGLNTDHLLKTVQDFVITFPTAITATWTFSGLVTKFKAGDFKMDGPVSFSASIKITGKPVLAVTASADITTLALECASGVISPSPNLTAAVYDYGLAVITTDAYVMVTVTDASASSIKATALGITWNLSTTVQSGHILIGAADTTTDLEIVVTDSGKVSKTYTVHVVRPAP
jgi:hypothetical protein